MSLKNKTAKNHQFDVVLDTLPDLTSSLLRDIYGVHKAFMFGTFKFKGYEPQDFMNDIKESPLSDDDAVSICKFVENDWYIHRLSLYPLWLIRDNLFQVFAVQFAVSHLVNSLEPKQIGSELSIHCVVIPESVVSLYDHDVHRIVSIDDVDICGREFCASLNKDIVDVTILVQHLEQGFISLLCRNPSKAIILVDRRGNFQNFLVFDDGKLPDTEPLRVSMAVSQAIDDLKITKPKLYDFKKQIIEYFEQNPQIDASYLAKVGSKQLAIPISKHCGSKKVKGSINFLRKKLLEKLKVESLEPKLKVYTNSLRKHHVLEMQYQLKGGAGKAIKSYCHFGYNQSIRFWPEQLIWFIPRLFLRENGNDYNYLERLYGADYKHGFCVSLEDEEFSRFYKMLTGWDHVSVNYRRTPLKMSHSKSELSGFRDLMDTKLGTNESHKSLRYFADFQGYDSDAILDDIRNCVIGNSVAAESKECNIVNIFSEMDSSGDTFEKVTKLIPKYLESKPGKCTTEHRLEAWSCPSIKQLIINLQKFKSMNFKIDAGNLEDFNHSDIIRQMDHLVTVHALFSDENSAKIRNIIRDQIHCDLSEDCTAFGLYCSLRREDDESEQKEEDEITAICSETKYSLCSSHCYLLHAAKYLYRMSGNNNKFDVKPFSMEVVEEKTSGGQGGGGAPLSIDWGQHILQWLPFGESPNFKSFLEEMARNPASTVGPRALGYLRAECKVLIEGTEYELDEMMGLKAYSDLTKFQKEFRRAHWKRTELEIKKNFYHWASTMYKTFLFHSKPIQKKREFDSPIPIYHGLDRMFTVDTATPSFQGPFSTTISDQVVRRFASDEGGRGRGLEFTLQSSYHNPLRVVTGINMVRISSFKHEQEILLYAQSTPISKTKAYEKEDDKLVNHLISSVQKRETLITGRNAFYKQIGFKFKKRWINLILKHPELFANSEYEHRIVAHRLQHELGILINKTNVHYGENNRLEIESEVQFEIMRSLKVPDSGVYFRITEDVVISSNTVIGVEDENENMESNTAKYIIFESSGRITNGGFMQNINSVDPMIALYGVDGVQNDGVIECGINGLVIIECSEFVNNGVIAPRPIVVIGRTGTDESFIRDLATMNKEEPIKLMVRKHRGHGGVRHPQNLLKEGTGDFYISGSKYGPPNEDWIVVKHNEESRFIPIAVIIRNRKYGAGIRRIAFYGWNNIDDLKEWIEIDGIHNEDGGRQIFPIGSRQRWIAYIEQFKYFKLRILENHGNEHENEFYEFAILGARIS